MFGTAVHAQQPATPPPRPPTYGPPVTIERAKKAVALRRLSRRRGPITSSPSPSSTQPAIWSISKKWTAHRPPRMRSALARRGPPPPSNVPPRLFSTRWRAGIRLSANCTRISPPRPAVFRSWSMARFVGAIGVSGGANVLMDAVAAQAGADALKQIFAVQSRIPPRLKSRRKFLRPLRHRPNSHCSPTAMPSPSVSSTAAHTKADEKFAT